jgi:phosphomannomutase
MTIQLSFGTAGIRAALGPGPDQINVRTVGGVAHALCSYLVESSPGAAGRGLCVGFDGRTDSDRFAREVVRVALAHGFRVRAFETPTPTPLLAFCTRFYQCAAGVMVTASHNPAHENGLKLYLDGGAQVMPPHDREIARRIARFEDADLPTGGVGEPVYEALGERELEGYLAAIEQLVELPSAAPLPRFAYSALSGVGSAVTRRVFVRAGAHDVLEVASQAEPRSDLGGLASPNPEHRAALSALFELADRERIDLAFAHDPDADRLAIAVRDRAGVLQLLSGDEVGALLGAFMLECTRDPTRALLVSTLVSGELLEHIARAAGAHFERTPTGFRWIAARARELERTAGLDFVFGYEEAIGYAFGRIADDKDGIAALYVMLELVRRLHTRGQTLLDRLDELARAHGVFTTRQVTLARGRMEHGDTDVMTLLRAVDPGSLLGPGAVAIDYAQRRDAIDLLVLKGVTGERLCVRPSGTEPKLKLYLHAQAAVTSTVEQARAEAAHKLDLLEMRVRAVQGGER